MLQGNILIVDDNPDNLQVLESILATNGYDVRAAVSGKIALKAIAARPPDLILLDVMMPDMDGLEVCRRLKGDPATADIPVLFVSGLAETGEKVSAFECGGLDYITKPFAEQEVLARVRTHLLLAATQRELLLINRKLTVEIEARKSAEVASRRQLQTVSDNAENSGARLRDRREPRDYPLEQGAGKPDHPHRSRDDRNSGTVAAVLSVGAPHPGGPGRG